MRNAGLEKAQGGINIARRNIKNLRYADDTSLMAESGEVKSGNHQSIINSKAYHAYTKTSA